MAVRHRPGQQLSFFAEWSVAANDARTGARAGMTPPEVTSSRIRRRMALAAAAVAAGVAALIALPATTASADPSANDWYRLRMCESSNNYSINT
ncbi:MAG: hypothetical protein DLM57_09530, partial [Pseudonocardiales bacterium]